MRAGTISAVFRTTSPGSQASSCRSLSGEISPGKHHWNGHCLGIFAKQAPLERYCVFPDSSEINRDHTAPLEQYYLGIFGNTRTVETTPPRNTSETTTTFPLATTLPQELSAATQSFCHNHSPQLSQMYAVSTTHQTGDWDIDFSAHFLQHRRLFNIFSSIATISDRNVSVHSCGPIFTPRPRN